MAASLTPDRLAELVGEIRDLLATTGETGWSRSFAQIALQLEQARQLEQAQQPGEAGPGARQEVVRGILHNYGGMGSFNDVVLQNSSGVLPEQHRLDQLRSELYQQAVSELA